MTGQARLVRSGAGIVGVACALLLSACVSPTEFFNPEFLQTLGVGAHVASLPGEAPALLVEVENGTSRPVEFLLTWRTAENEVGRFAGSLPPGAKNGQVLFCSIPELTLGDVGNLDATGAIVRLGAGGVYDPFIEVEPFGVLLQEGINYDCGDAVTFVVLPSGATMSGYQLFAYIRRAEAQAGTS